MILRSAGELILGIIFQATMLMNQAHEYSPDVQLARFRIRQGAILWLPDFKEVKRPCHERRKSNSTWPFSRLFNPVRIRAPQNAPPFTLTMYGHPILVVSGPQTGSHGIDFFLVCSRCSLPYESSTDMSLIDDDSWQQSGTEDDRNC